MTSYDDQSQNSEQEQQYAGGMALFWMLMGHGPSEHSAATLPKPGDPELRIPSVESGAPKADLPRSGSRRVFTILDEVATEQRSQLILAVSNMQAAWRRRNARFLGRPLRGATRRRKDASVSDGAPSSGADVDMDEALAGFNEEARRVATDTERVAQAISGGRDASVGAIRRGGESPAPSMPRSSGARRASRIGQNPAQHNFLEGREYNADEIAEELFVFEGGVIG